MVRPFLFGLEDGGGLYARCCARRDRCDEVCQNQCGEMRAISFDQCGVDGSICTDDRYGIGAYQADIEKAAETAHGGARLWEPYSGTFVALVGVLARVAR